MNSLLRIFLLAFAVASTVASLPSLLEDEAEDHDDRLGNKIIDGTRAKKGQFPWQASLFILDVAGVVSSCGGSLIHPSWILTAAHCTIRAVGVEVRLGSLQWNSGGVSMVSTTIFNHERYNVEPNIGNFNHDIALIRLPFAVRQSDDIKVIKLVPDSVKVFNKLQISGWGRMSDNSEALPESLLFADVVQISYEECLLTHPFVTPQTMCTVGSAKDPFQASCDGDSGGPVIIPGPTPYLVASVSFVRRNGCTQGLPEGNLRVVPYKTWIKNRTGLTL